MNKETIIFLIQNPTLYNKWKQERSLKNKTDIGSKDKEQNYCKVTSGFYYFLFKCKLSSYNYCFIVANVLKT